jgi:hypothetical protein
MVSLMSLQYISYVMMLVANVDCCDGLHRTHAFKESRIFIPLMMIHQKQVCMFVLTGLQK